MKHLILLLLSTLGVFDAFLVPPQRPLTRPAARHPQRPDVSVGLFGDFFKKLRGDKDGGEDGSKASDTDAPLPEKAETTPEAKADGASFFVQSSTPPPTPQEQETPESVAQKLRAQAARIRLEAEKSQVQLTIDKISKLDSQLQKVKTKQDAGEAVDEKERRSLEENLALLQSQLVKDEKGVISFVPPKVVPLPNPNATSSKESTIVKIDSSVPAEERLVTQESIPPPLSEEDLQAIVQKYNEAPEFLRTMIAKIAGFADDPSNSTAIINQLYQDEQQIELQTAFLRTNITESRSMLERAYAKSKDLEPSQAEIEDKVEQLGNLPTFVKKLITGSTNDTEIALDLLREQGKRNKKKIEGGLFGFSKDKTKDNVIGRDGERLNKNSGTFDRMFTQDEDTETIPSLNNDLSLLMESTFPKSTRKEGETPSQKEVNTFINQVLGVTGAFVPEGEALLVPGGWIIRGKNKCKSGDELIDKLDRRISNVASLRDNISFFLIKDPFPPNQEDVMLDPLNWPQVLFVTGSDVARDPRPVLGTVISAVGIATTWYASIYPFLTNSKLLDRAEEAMNLADAGMPADLSWLSDECIPLFFAFMGLQLLHETAHVAIAKSKNFEVTVPTLIPSIISGITGSITSLKTSPKNKSDLLLFSVAGPLTGILASLLLEAYGLALTASADLQTLQSFPGLPLALLRQSSLGGGLIDLVLGNGVLNVPSSIEGANLLASTVIQLHPFAIAGFVSLLVNALALVPAGRTDGGRISMSLFGRSGSQGLTLVSLGALFLVGITGSDLLLFYFGFVVLAQLELEIPLRNEIDDVGLPGVLLAALAGFLTVLTLVPM